MTPPREATPVGYQALVDELGLSVMPLALTSLVRPRGVLRVESGPDQAVQYFPSGYAPESTPTGQLEFALKYEGVNLEVLRAVFDRLDARELAAWVRSKPTGRFTRRVWFLCEWLTGKVLDVPDATRVAYVDALGADRHFTATGVPSPRHRVRNDLLGVPSFCPMVRRTEALGLYAAKGLGQRARAVVAGRSAALVHRAAQFLYLKETKSSFEIEREHPDRRRTLMFVELLRAAASVGELSERVLVALQRAILDPRYAKDGYRQTQNYVGQTLPGYRELVHYVAPKPQDVAAMMDGLLQCSARLAESDVDPVVQAAMLGFGLVFVHPFDDGNGRLHRYLIHHVLARTGFTPEGMVLPVSAGMLADPRAYDGCLERFSRPLLARLEYDLDPQGAMTVRGETADYYRYFDATAAAEYLYGVVERTIEHDLAGELDFLARFDAAWRDLREIVDLPDRRLELFLRLCLGNHGKLSARKRALFAELTDEELAGMEAVVQASGLEDDEGPK